MLAVRIIPTLMFDGDKLIKGERFNAWRSVGHVRQAVEIHAGRGVDELCMLDIGASKQGRGPDFDRVRELTLKAFTPVTVGGGVRTVADIRGLLNAGADKVCIGRSAFSGSGIVSKGAHKFGSQCIVVAVNAHDTQHALDLSIVAQEMEAGEILLTAVKREGTMEGYDIDMIRSVCESVTIPVIAHGGCSGPDDMLRAISAGASAVAAGALFQFTDHTPSSCADALDKKGVRVRKR